MYGYRINCLKYTNNAISQHSCYLLFYTKPDMIRIIISGISITGQFTLNNHVFEENKENLII